MTHIASDALKFGPLDEISAFPFENKLKAMKRLICKPQSPLQQLCRRLYEIDRFSNVHENLKSYPILRHHHFHGPLPPCSGNVSQFREIQFENQFFSTSSSDNCILTNKNKPCLIRNIVQGRNLEFVIKSFEICENLFEYPMSSSKIGIYKAKQLSGEYQVISVTDVLTKCLCLPYTETDFVVMPLLHISN